MSQKLWGVFVCGQLWILYYKINFEILYFTQFSIFFEKNKIIGCRLFIATSQTFVLAFFNCITKFLTILYFESFFSSFYLLFFSYLLYNSKWFKNFQPCSQLALKNESKEAPPFQTFFIEMWACELQLPSFLQGQVKDFCKFKSSHLAIHTVEISKFFPHVFKSTYHKILWLHMSNGGFFSKIWYLY